MKGHRQGDADMTTADLDSATMITLKVEGDTFAPMTLADFFRDQDGIDEIEQGQIRRTIRAGCVFWGGGGAAVEYSVHPA